MADIIRVTYSSIDRFRKSASFKTLAGARAFAHRYVGAHPDLGSTYAVSDDGVGKIEVRGVPLADLFPPPGDVNPPPSDGELALRESHRAHGVCHRHPTIRVSTGGGFPMFDGVCGACESEMDASADEEHEAVRRVLGANAEGPEW